MLPPFISNEAASLLVFHVVWVFIRSSALNSGISRETAGFWEEGVALTLVEHTAVYLRRTHVLCEMGGRKEDLRALRFCGEALPPSSQEPTVLDPALCDLSHI
jgi:hypothetical protein